MSNIIPKESDKLVIIVNGPATAGKDTFCNMYIDYIKERHDIRAKSISSVDRVKDAAKILNWHGEKDAESRNALSDLKVLSEKVWNGPNTYMLNAIENQNDIVTFLHIREPENINVMIDECVKRGYTVRTLYVERNVEQKANNVGDAGAHDRTYPYQDVINNNGTLDDLLGEVRRYFSIVKTKNAVPFVKLETYTETITSGIIDVQQDMRWIADSYQELVEVVGDERTIKDNIAKFMGGEVVDSKMFEHPHTGREVFTQYWSFKNGTPPDNSIHEIGIFEYDTSWNSLIPVIAKSEYEENEIDVTDIKATFKAVALHVHNTQEVLGISIENI